jgi:hypothetical protein
VSIYEIVGLTVFCLGTITVGIVCLWCPENVRDYALRTTPNWIPFRSFMEGRSYMWCIRLTGVIASLMLLLVLYVVIFGRN